MKVLFNTNYKSAGTKVCVEDLSQKFARAGHSISFNDWGGYMDHNLALFMAPDSKIREAKKANPKILCGLMDPKMSTKKNELEARAADFLIVSSIEQRDFFLKYNKNIFIYYMFPDVPAFSKTHSQKDKIIIGYHGNKQHLDAMADVSWALDELAKNHNIELWAIYNIEKLGKWTQNCPSVCTVKHIQWFEESLIENLKVCDIGVAPSLIPAGKFFTHPLLARLWNPVGYSKNDYVSRYKMSNNPGRLYVFSQMGIPVVADFTPSAGQMIQDGVSGRLVGTPEGWKYAIEELIRDSEKRNEMSQNLQKFIHENCSPDKNFETLMKNIKILHGQ